MILDARLSKACIDIDGVLCRDPTPQENANHDLYLKFLKEVKPSFQTEIPLGILVSARLEKYRPIITEWLNKNNFKYQDIILFDAPNEHIRNLLGFRNLIKFKYDALVNSGFDLFIESNLSIASALKQMNPSYQIFCTQTNSFL